MACITDHYKVAAIAVAKMVSGTVEWLTPWMGEPLAIVSVGLAMLPPAWLMFQGARLWVPDFSKWWYDEAITQKAREYVRRKCPATGMTINGAKISFVSALGMFLLTRFVVSLPLYYAYSFPTLALAFCAVAVVGYFVGGNVPDNPKARFRYFWRFQSPSIAGMGFAIASTFFEFLLEASILAIGYA
jgi:hypothetical protein